MWRTVLVDDEEYVRTELAALFPWSRYQFELVGEAENAFSALALIKEARPDLVITDIRMPEMDGLALISRLGQDHPQLKVAVVSAFNDFPYVREALRLGAVDYLMKAEATVETAGAFLKRIAGILEDQSRALNQQEEMTNNLARYHWLATESFWRDVLTRASDEPEIAARARQLGIAFDDFRFGLIFIHIAHYQKGSEEDQAEIRRGMEEKIRLIWEKDWTWELIDFYRGDFVIVAGHKNSDPQISQRLQSLACGLATGSGGKWTTSASSMMGFFSDLPRHFKEVHEVNLLRLYHRKSHYLNADYLLKLRQATPPNIPEILTSWERALRVADPNAIRDILSRTFEAVIPSSLSPEEARRLVLELINAIRRISFEHQVRWGDLGSQESDLPEILAQAETLDDWRNRVEKLAAHYLQSAKANLYPQISSSIRKALLYIQSNFSRDLSLEEVADNAGISKSYLSRVFPEYTGEYFSDYLQRLRIERAKELLRFTNDHIYEIASKVGFWSSRYFSKVFHDAVGMTPADYRRNPQIETK